MKPSFLLLVFILGAMQFCHSIHENDPQSSDTDPQPSLDTIVPKLEVSECYNEPRHAVPAIYHSDDCRGLIHLQATEDGRILVTHEDLLANCCATVDVKIIQTNDEEGEASVMWEIFESEVFEDGEGPCRCECYRQVSTTIEDLTKNSIAEGTPCCIVFYFQRWTNQGVIKSQRIEFTYTSDLDTGTYFLEQN